jgi:malic enzyme
VSELQEVSLRVASRVMERAIAEGVARRQGLEDVDCETYLRKQFWKPRYLPFVRGG